MAHVNYEKRRQYQKEYWRRPGVKEKHRTYSRQAYRKKRGLPLHDECLIEKSLLVDGERFKVCNNCFQLKSEDEFHKRSDKKAWQRQSMCKPCKTEYNRNLYRKKVLGL
nr:hypothetical protein BdHM001_18610 [Bdellovibrio sp. HM001]